MIKLFLIMMTALGIGYGSWWWFQRTPALQNFIEEYIKVGKFYTLEIRFSSKAIVENNRDKLIKSEQYSIEEPTLLFYPYLLLQVKFSNEKDATEEGMLLWGLHDGEIVIDTSDWKRSNGFQDCIMQGANKNDFKVIYAVEKLGENCDRRELLDRLRIDEATFDEWIQSCKKKNFIIQNGNKYRLHFSSPKFDITPKTNIQHQIVRNVQEKDSPRIPKKFNGEQIKEISKFAFGANFAIRSFQEVFLPVYKVVVSNPDGSISVTYWNALNGKIMPELNFV